MAISDDFTIDYTRKVIKHTNGTTIYTVNQLYSYLMDTFDELGQMDDTVPMTAQTPTAYTMTNGWWLDIGETNATHKYLRGGAIATLGYNSEIHLVKYDNVTTALDTNDINEEVYDDGTQIGPLLGYDSTTAKLWIRDNRPTFSVIADNSYLSGGATGGFEVDSNGQSKAGNELFANVYTLGTIETTPSPQVYIFQSGAAISEWSNLTNWDRGHIDVLIQVKEAGEWVVVEGTASGNITVFARQYGDLYDHFGFNIQEGGRNPIPLATSRDLNNTTPEYYLLYRNMSNGPFTAGSIISDSDDESNAAEVMSVVTWGISGALGLGGVKGTFASGVSFEVGSTKASGVGLIGETLIRWDAQDEAFLHTGQIVTGLAGGAKREVWGILRFNGSGLLVGSADHTVSGTARGPYYRAFSDNETISGSIEGWASSNGVSSDGVAGFDDVTIAFVNGAATVTEKSTTSLTEGERIQWSATGNAIVIYDSGNSLVLGNVTATDINGKTYVGDLTGASGQFSSALGYGHTAKKGFPQQTRYPWDVIVECGSIYNSEGRTLGDVYEYFKYVCKENSTYTMYTQTGSSIVTLDGEEYIQAYPPYTPVKAAPFGTFAGGVLFGAQGIWVEGMHSDDTQNFQLIDSDGTTRTPPVTVSIIVTALISGDRVSVFRRSGNSNEVDKWMYLASSNVNVSGRDVFETKANLAADTPQTNGYIRVISGLTEQRYKYSEWLSGNMFLLTGQLSTSYDESLGNYCYVPFIDRQATAAVHQGSTSITVQVTYASNRYVVTRVRHYGGQGDSIIPFQVNGEVTNAGFTQAAIRTEDTIVT